MDLGYSITSFHPPDVDPRSAASDVLDRSAVAADAGFDSVEAGDHHNIHGGGYLQNVPMAARLSSTFDVVSGMFLLPLYHPVLVAEQVATLDALVDRFDLWCAVGYGAEQFRAFGVPMAERAPRFEEMLAVLEMLWTGDAVTYDGEFYSIDDVSVAAADPRICIGGTAEPAVRRAGRLGDAWVANADVPLDAIRQRVGWVDEAGGGEIIVRRDALVLDDGPEAREAATGLLEAGYRGWGTGPEWVLTGAPADVARRLDELAAAGADAVVVRPMSDQHAEETLRGVARARDLA